MKKRRLLPSLPSTMRGIVCMLTIFSVTLALVLTGLVRTGYSVRSEGWQSAAEAVRRAALCCYALEGAYPESYEYLKNHYPPGINESLYTVHYIAFSPSLMPEITVVRQGTQP
ncbi:MAG: hypothetical protein CVU91_06330 [Firmicutes bacterium HGW-Firmicutes-16]|nr:MAG: hypothetical protein CVU91_06330 [Firmicutes bacterium HGW-Firmicutes-16]